MLLLLFGLVAIGAIGYAVSRKHKKPKKPHPPHPGHPHHPELIAYITARLESGHKRKDPLMALSATLGQNVILTINGHSAINGAVIPSGSTVAIVSNDASVITVADVPPLTSDMLSIVTPCTLLTAGSSDVTATVTAPDGSVFTATDSIIVNPVAVPGLTHIDAVLSVV